VLKFKCFFVVLLCFIVSTKAIASIDLSSPINCTYQVGQILDKDEAVNIKNNKPLNWTFNGLLSKKSVFVAGGDSGDVIAIKMREGIIIYLPDQIGTSTFTIWNTGESFWGKQSNVLGSMYSQQYLGICVN
jgi:hypothetical protein